MKSQARGWAVLFTTHVVKQVEDQPSFTTHVVKQVEDQPSFTTHVVKQVEDQPSFTTHVVKQVEDQPSFTTHVEKQVELRCEIAGTFTAVVYSEHRRRASWRPYSH